MQSQKYWQRVWRLFRDVLWPVLEQEVPQEHEQEEPQEQDKSESTIQEECIVIEDENLDQALELITKFAESEEDRLKTVESKAALLLSVTSITTTLIIASLTLLSRDVGKTWFVLISGTAFILGLYTIKTVFFTVKALKRGNYHTLSFKDINQKGEKNSYRKHLILRICKNVSGNFETINSKVDNMHMAQEYYMRAISVIGLYLFLIFLSYLF